MVAAPGSFQLVEKVRSTPAIYSKLSKSGENHSLFSAFDACGRVIVAQGGTLTVPPHTPLPSEILY